MGVLSIILQVLLGVGFLMFGFMKFGSKQMVDEFVRYGYPVGFRIFTGLVEVITAVFVISGIWNDKLAAWGGLFIVGTMLGGIFTHIKVKDPVNKMIMPIVLLILGLIVLIINFGSLL
ncbi:DoxX family protein [Metabacillus bambusae]|uniref:DoxX family protein n=1 Tax=Metabacillus bambusae TaxID=2795218 RepID=A0ABS3MZN4_9BACI|nr:DoxX family protein [Metabacillus bambusae]MBO1511486.1 DoxX family protein [Metabacillus bambusae]